MSSKFCKSKDCIAWGVDQFDGYCHKCWMMLKASAAPVRYTLPPSLRLHRVYLVALAAVLTPEAARAIWHWLNRLLAVSIVLMLVGCKDATRAQWGAMGSKHTVTVYSGGIAVKVFHSTGNVSNQGQSDGYYFEDAATHKLVEVSGTVVIEQE